MATGLEIFGALMGGDVALKNRNIELAQQQQTQKDKETEERNKLLENFDIGNSPTGTSIDNILPGLFPKGTTMQRKPSNLDQMIQYFPGLQGLIDMGGGKPNTPGNTINPNTTDLSKVYMKGKDPKTGKDKIYEMLPEDNIEEYKKKGWTVIGAE